ncbi:NAD-P-binding protein [Trametes maxima]|nr:NAD-P-binding protein [Trametes maxima]
MSTFYAVVGASRGVGLEYIRQLAARENVVVFAVVRSKQSSPLLTALVADLNNVHIIEGDVTEYDTIKHAAEEISSISGGKLDYLIHNAAKMDTATLRRGFDDYADMDELDADFLEGFKVNALGVVHSLSALVPLLRAGSAKKIVVVSSGAGHPPLVRAVGITNMVQYGTTKAAQLLLVTKWALKLKDEGFVVVAMNPGHVDTSGTKQEDVNPAARAAMLRAAEGFRAAGFNIETQTPAQSVSRQLQVIDGLKESDNGTFLQHTGQKVY